MNFDPDAREMRFERLSKEPLEELIRDLALNMSNYHPDVPAEWGYMEMGLEDAWEELFSRELPK